MTRLIRGQRNHQHEWGSIQVAGAFDKRLCRICQKCGRYFYLSAWQVRQAERAGR